MGSNNHRPSGGFRDSAVVQTEAEIAKTRELVARSLGELQRELARAVDWREWIRRQPVLAVGVAFGLGLLLGRPFRQPRTGRDHGS
jgi:ElaB/YqjD/DUF883 family membrane-anchored ribosome-binding protein